MIATSLKPPTIYDQIPTIRENLVKIGPVDPEFSLLKSLFKKKKLTQAEHNPPGWACMPRWLKMEWFGGN